MVATPVRCPDDAYFVDRLPALAATSPHPRTKVACILRCGMSLIKGVNTLPGISPRHPDRIGVEEFLRGEHSDMRRWWFLHAEHRVIARAAREGTRTLNSTLYTNLFCCAHCSGSLVEAGIARVVIDYEAHFERIARSPKWIKEFAVSEQILRENGVEIFWYARPEIVVDAAKSSGA